MLRWLRGMKGRSLRTAFGEFAGWRGALILAGIAGLIRPGRLFAEHEGVATLGELGISWSRAVCRALKASSSVVCEQPTFVARSKRATSRAIRVRPRSAARCGCRRPKLGGARLPLPLRRSRRVAVLVVASTLGFLSEK